MDFADISRRFMAERKVFKYHMKNIEDMSDAEIVKCCHWYCEENNLKDDWNKFLKKIESEYHFCDYLSEYIEDGYCFDLQMISEGLLKPTALPETTIDKEKLKASCKECKYRLE